MKLLFLLCLVLALILLGLVAQRLFFSFAAQDPQSYAATDPGFDIRVNLNGPILSEGVIFGPTGAMSSRFVAQMRGQWQGDSGTLSEDLTYADGSTQARLWTLTMGEGGAFTATAPDIEGLARGQQSGATVRMTYRLRLPADAGGHVLDVTDWLYLMPNGAIMNKSEMRKFGVKVAELVATMRPADQ